MVWLADDRETGEEVAVKILRPMLAAEPEVLARFVAEAELLRSVSHNGVVAVRDVVAEGGALAVVMDLVHGSNLRTLFAGGAALPAPEVCRLGAQVATALAAVHAAGIVHADLKPENILVDGPVIKLADFGVARLVGGQLGGGLAGGTPGYQAPELRRGRPPSAAADVFALGVVLYESCTAVLPRPGPLSRSDRGRLASDCPPELTELVVAALAFDPRRRPAARTMAVRLADIGAAGGDRQRSAVRDTSPVDRSSAALPAGSVVPRPAGCGPLYEQYAGDRRPTVLHSGSARAGMLARVGPTRPRASRHLLGRVALGLSVVLLVTALALVLDRSVPFRILSGGPPSTELPGRRANVAHEQVIYYAPTGWLCGPLDVRELARTNLRIQPCLLVDGGGTAVAVVTAGLGTPPTAIGKVAPRLRSRRRSGCSAGTAASSWLGLAVR